MISVPYEAQNNQVLRDQKQDAVFQKWQEERRKGAEVSVFSGYRVSAGEGDRHTEMEDADGYRIMQGGDGH